MDENNQRNAIMIFKLRMWVICLIEMPKRALQTRVREIFVKYAAEISWCRVGMAPGMHVAYIDWCHAIIIWHRQKCCCSLRKPKSSMIEMDMLWAFARVEAMLHANHAAPASAAEMHRATQNERVAHTLATCLNWPSFRSFAVCQCVFCHFHHDFCVAGAAALTYIERTSCAHRNFFTISSPFCHWLFSGKYLSC